LTQRIKDLGGEVTYSVNKSVNFLVISDQTFQLSNKTLLQEGAIFTEAGPSENNIRKNSAEKSTFKLKNFEKDGSLKYLS